MDLVDNGKSTRIKWIINNIRIINVIDVPKYSTVCTFSENPNNFLK